MPENETAPESEALNPGRRYATAERIARKIERLVQVAGGALPADLVLKGASVVNVLSGEVHGADVAISGGVIAGIGRYDRAKEVADLGGRFLLPGLIDGHIHLESSMLTPEGFAAAVLPHGTTAVVADPHEIVNVCGMDGFAYMVDAGSGLPLDIFYTVPSCVPATSMETSGVTFGVREIAEAFLLHPRSPALAEMMNYPGVTGGDKEVLLKIAYARSIGKLVDGHAPLLGGKNLSAYLAAGISSDHECTSPEEALEKLRRGMSIAIREGSEAKNLEDLLPIINEHNASQVFFCSDDVTPRDLVEGRHLSAILARAVALGLPPVRAVQMATINPARHYRLGDRGVVAPGYTADLAVVDDLKEFKVAAVYKNGSLAAQNGKLLLKLPVKSVERVTGTVSIPDLTKRLGCPRPPVKSTGDTSRKTGGSRARVIEVIPGQIITGCSMMTPAEIEADPGVRLVAVVERHGINGNVATGFVKGFGPLRGALASTVAHDSHNLLLVGSTPGEMILAAAAVAELGGGLAVVGEERVLAKLALPVAGLMSDLDAGAVAGAQGDLKKAAESIGCTLPEPFMTLSFLALPVIPRLKITDLGLVDVDSFQVVDLWVDG